MATTNTDKNNKNNNENNNDNSILPGDNDTTPLFNPPLGSSTSNNNDQNDNNTEELPKMFVTTSDVLKQLNTNLKKYTAPEDQYLEPRFELQRKLPDGSSIPATESDIAASDFQTKLQQSAQVIESLPTPELKLEWANHQRQMGNQYYQHADYKNAMDIYLTCLLVKDQIEQQQQEQREQDKNNSNDNRDTTTNSITNTANDYWIQVYGPVLNNLAVCTLQLGMYNKTIKFCNMGLEHQDKLLKIKTTDTVLSVVKLYYKRAKAQRQTGLYKLAKQDLFSAQELLSSIQQDLLALSTTTTTSSNDGSNDSTNDGKKLYTSHERAIHKEMAHLERAIMEGKKNKQRQQKAMQRVLGGKEQQEEEEEQQQPGKNINDSTPKVGKTSTTNKNTNFNDATTTTTTTKSNPSMSLYADMERPRTHSTLRSRKRTLLQDTQKFETSSERSSTDTTKEKNNNDIVSFQDQLVYYWQWYWLSLARGTRKFSQWMNDHINNEANNK